MKERAEHDRSTGSTGAAVNAALLGGTTFAALGMLLLISAIRTFTSTLYQSLFGVVPNETVGVLALVVFAASILGLVASWRLGQRSSIALSGTLLAGGTLVATVWRWDTADIALSAAAVIGGTWWLALVQSSRSGSGG
ncbi:MAG TPA: hypothetical protein VE261_01995, partial [Gaiellaceae bacterium]|nr:hypothetical protein [Gaiellaceae bacterium]